MKVLFLLHFPPPVHGSSVVGQHIAESNHICESAECDFINLSTSDKIKEIGKKGLIKYWKSARIYAMVFRKLWKGNYDLCYQAITVSKPGLYKDAPLVLLSKLLGVKTLIHQHNKGVSENNKNRVYDFLYQLIYRNSKVILLSWRLYPDISKYVKKEDVFICPNGVPMVNESIPLVHTRNPCRILFLSNLIISKGCLVLLDACKKLKENNIHFICDYVGGETDELTKQQFEQEIQQRGLCDSVFYHGIKQSPEKEKYLRQADLFAFPTFYHNECFPLVLLEAMQYKLPVISTFEGAIQDIVEDGITGFLCMQKDVDSLYERMRFLIFNQDLRITMGEAGYKKYLKEYTLTHFEKNMRTILDTVLSKAR